MKLIVPIALALTVVVAGLLAAWLVPDNLSNHGLAVIMICATALIAALVEFNASATAVNLARIQDANVENLLNIHADLVRRLEAHEAKE